MNVLLLVLTLGLSMQDAESEAVRLARSGAHVEALRRFEQLVAANPADFESRIWMGRLLGWTGRRADAERVYRDVLAEAPTTIDAMLGLGSILVISGRVPEALTILERAVTLAPDSGDAQAALARACRFAGQTTRSIELYRKAVLLSPNDPDIRQGLDATRYLHDHRVQGTFVYEHFERDIPSARAASAEVNLRLNDAARLGLHAQVQRKFDRTEGRGGGELEWHAGRGVTMRAKAFGSPGAIVLSRADAGFDVERSGARFDLASSVRYAHFSTADVWIAAPGLTFWLNERTSLASTYYFSATTFSESDQTVSNHSGRVSARMRIRPRCWIDGGYARGNESFETLSIERLGRFKADTFSAGLRVDTRALQSIIVAGEYQITDRDRLFRLTLGFVERF
jgi:YaiO family outer membrane protein